MTGRRGRVLVLVFVLVVCAGAAYRFALKSEKVDAVAHCEHARRTGESKSEVTAGCASLYELPRCRAEYASKGDPSSYIRRVVTACAADYCPVLPSAPAVCQRLVRDGDAAELDEESTSNGVSEVAKHWQELDAAIITYHHGAGATERLAKAARASPIVVRTRATMLIFSLCKSPSGELSTPLGDKVTVERALVERFAKLVKVPSECGVGEAEKSPHTGVLRFLVDRAVVEFTYDAERDRLSVTRVAPVEKPDAGGGP